MAMAASSCVTSSSVLFPILLLATLTLIFFLVPNSKRDNQSTQNFTSLMQIRRNNETVLGSSVSLNNTLFPAASFESDDRQRHASIASSIKKKRSALGRIEKDLAEARAAIRRAVKFKNYTSDKEEVFIPRGSVYRNPSHIEMIKRFKVWTYKEGEPPLVHAGPANHIYAIEGQFIDEMDRDDTNGFAARSPEEAHAFFVPFSITNVIHYIYKPITSPADYSRDRLHRLFTDYVDVVAMKYPYWNRSSGADHFMVSCHDWAPDILDADPQFFKYFIRGLCNANMSEGFRPGIDFSVPEINLPKGKLGPPMLAKIPEERSILAFFAGRMHGYIRHILLSYWKDRDDDVRVYETTPKGQNYNELMGRSKFCLCPSGYEVASPREVEAIYAGCVPVIISDNYSLPFNDVLNWSRFSVHIPVEKIPEIKEILQSVPQRRYLKMQKRVMMVKRHFVVNRPARPFDVIHMVLHSLWLRRLNFKLTT